MSLVCDLCQESVKSDSRGAKNYRFDPILGDVCNTCLQNIVNAISSSGLSLEDAISFLINLSKQGYCIIVSWEEDGEYDD